MTVAKKKVPVRIVCPHCERSYVIQVDLQRIFRTSPRAICARCGRRFDVIQRMSEIDEADAAVETTQRRGDGEPGPMGRVEHIAPTRDLPAAAERSKRSRASSAPGRPAAGEGGERDGARAERAASGDDAQAPLPLLVGGSRAAEAAPLPERRPRAPSEPAPAPAAPPAAAAPSSLLPSRAPGEIAPPAAADLERPLPWADPPALGLELEDRAQPESATALDWLLTSAETPRKTG